MATDALIEKKLREIQQKLSSPSDVKQLVLLLDELELFISKVGQSPPDPISRAIEQIIKQLTIETYLKHSNKDVKLAVASCLSQITRITAPDVPFDDNTAIDVFQLIIEAFKDIHNLTSPLNRRRISILDICAKIRSSLILLDLDCDDMVLDMFHHFLKNLRPDHPQVVFTSMENIMTILIKESEDIKPEILSDLLDTLKLTNVNILPIARRLARKVMANTADKIRICLMRLVELNRINLSEYDGLVAHIWQGGSEALVDFEKDGRLSNSTISDELQQDTTKGDNEAASPEKSTSTGSGHIPNANSLSSKPNLDFSVANQESLKANSSAQKVASVTCIHSDNETDCQKKTDAAQDDKDNTIMNAMKVDSEKKHDNTLKSKKSKERSHSKPVGNIDEVLGIHPNAIKESEPQQSDDASYNDPVALKDNELKGEEAKEESNSTKKGKSRRIFSENDISKNKQKSNPKKPKKFFKCEASVDKENKSLVGSKIEVWWVDDQEFYSGVVQSYDPDTKKHRIIYDDGEIENLTLKDEQYKLVGSETEKLLVNSSKLGSTSKGKGDNKLSGCTVSDELPEVFTEGDTEVASPENFISTNSGEQKSARSRRNANSTSSKSSLKSTSSKGTNKRLSEGKSLNKRRAGSNGTLDSKETPVKGEKENEDDAANVSKPCENIQQSISSKGKGESSRKAKPEKSKGQNKSKAAKYIDDASVHKENEGLVGSKIAVWWEDDQEFYNGVVESYDPDTKKHTIVYDDGETEILTLKDERYKLDESESKKKMDNESTDLEGSEFKDNESANDDLLKIKWKSSPKRQKKNDKSDASVDKENKRLVGSKIEVWWADDKEFYSGVVESYDPDTKKHKIVYDDGEIEVLTLKDERYRLDGSVTSHKDEGSSSKISKGKTVHKP